jgi:hypothetical protein
VRLTTATTRRSSGVEKTMLKVVEMDEPFADTDHNTLRRKA